MGDVKNHTVSNKKPPLSDSRFFRLQDILIYAVCILGILVSLNFFRLDLFRTLTRQTEQPVGIITFKYKAAQRRFEDRVLWDRLKRESPVYNGDLIRTADLSEATLTFADGTVLDLAENSLIQVQVVSSGTWIDISEGEVSANTASAASALVLVSGDSQVAMDTGAVVSAGVNGGDFLFQVVEGNAAYTVNGETGTAAAGEAFVLGGETGPRAVRDAAALSPRPAARFLDPGGGKLTIPFRWNRLNLEPEDPVRLEIAEDRGFTRIVFQEEFTGDTAAAALGPGSWFWRLSVPKEESGFSALSTYALKVVSSSAPVLITPAEGSRYQFRVKKPALRFTWAETADASAYTLEVADNPGMVNPALVKNVRGTSLSVSDLGAGTWYWRVQPVFPAVYEGTVGEGPAVSFSVVQSGDLGVPELRTPSDRGVVNIAANRGDLHFSWRNEPEARSYTIRISANRDLSNPLINETVRENFYVYRARETVLTPGQYYWGVLQTDVEGNPSVFSPSRLFTALEGEMIQRTVFPPEGYTIAAVMMPDIRFTWKTNAPFQTRLQIADRADFSRLVIDEPVRGETFYGRLLPEGTWYWRIQARGFGDLVFETPPKSFTTVPYLAAPALLEPGLGRRVIVQEGEPTVFSWAASPGAEYYQFKLFYAGNRNRAVYENNLVQGTSQSLSMNAYPEGEYVWTVQGFASESSRSTRLTGLLSEEAFNARKLHPVSLEYPDNGAVFEGLEAYYEPVTVRWSQTDPVTGSRFILSRNRDFSGPPAAEINNPSQTVTLSRLRPGDYYWTVRAETEGGFDISARTPRLFRVLPIPLLPAAANRTPRNGTVITGADLRQNRRILFSWDVVPEAAGYLFAVEHRETRRAVVPERLLTASSFVLEDLTLLDRGEFIWRVEAVLTEPVLGGRENEEEIIRRGETGENRFSIEFDLPDTPEPLRPGLLYGKE
jgi:hypothetical protein